MTDDTRPIQLTGTTVVISGVNNCGETTYHTAAECYQRARMRSEKRVDVSVAEWKGLRKCRRCAELEGDA